MLTLRRNQQVVYYCNPVQVEGVREAADGYLSGNHVPEYTEPVALLAYVSPPSGRAVPTMFGLDIRYDKVLIPGVHPCPIEEGAVLFVDGAPTFDSDGRPLFDYYAVRVAESLNFSHVAIRRAEVS